ncbi:MAG: putative lipid II flippase FtsW [bacterium]|nr:putative lipid II flippase FtsW [bacterium]
MPKTNKKPDIVLLGVIFALIALGLIILASVSASFSLRKFGDTYHLLKHQLIFGLFPGLILGYAAYRISLERVKKYAPALLLFSLALLVMVFLPFVGSELEGASRWIGLGPFTFQPSELLKLAFILYMASWLVSRSGKATKGFSQTFLGFLFILVIISALLIFQPDISTLGVVIFIALALYFSARTPFWHTILTLIMGAGALAALIKIAPYRLGRIMVFLNPDFDPFGIGYQAKQALIAVGSGGVIGLGLGMSVQKLGFLPQSVSDSIFAIFSEETGFIGALILISLFLLFLWRGLKIIKGSSDKFYQLTALGIIFWIVVQSFVNIGAMIGILPLTGIPLPFISYGGSALVIELIAMGLLLNISKT